MKVSALNTSTPKGLPAQTNSSSPLISNLANKDKEQKLDQAKGQKDLSPVIKKDLAETDDQKKVLEHWKFLQAQNQRQALPKLVADPTLPSSSPSPSPSYPGTFFLSGFDYLGLSRDSADGMKLLSQSLPASQHFTWDEKDALIQKIDQLPTDQKISLIGHSLGSDTAVEVAQFFNERSAEQGPKRTIDLLVTIDSFGLDNNYIPENVKKNLNFIGQKDFFLNDGPNAPLRFADTHVDNYVRPEKHVELDDAVDIHQMIKNELNQL